MQYLTFFFLQQPATAQNQLVQMLPLLLIVVIFYVLVFLPMQRQKKQQAAMLAGLQNGNVVLTSGGIVGTIVSINGDTLILRVKPDNVKLQFARSAVAGLVTDESPKS